MATIAVIGMPGLQVHIDLLAQTGFPSVPSVHFGEIMLLGACCELGQT
jgi:hypothetical protein